ncbi:MAG: hypothetical protein OXH20_13765 [bacterium]|nr:hypothetical protein [bacterium]
MTLSLSVSDYSLRCDLRLLQDSQLPVGLSAEVGNEIELVRWDGGEASDTELIREAVERRCRGVLLVGRSSLDQPGLREEAKQSGIALIAVVADDPIEAKQRVVKNARSIRKALADSNAVLVFANEVRAVDGGDR